MSREDILVHAAAASNDAPNGQLTTEEAAPQKSLEECARALMKAHEQHDNPDHPERIKALRDYEEALHR